MQEAPLTEQESLELIESMINHAKNQFNENGHLYLLWGWVISFCSIGQFVLLHIFHSPWCYSVWWLTWAVVVYQFIYIKRKIKHQRVKTYMEDILTVIWLAFIVAILLFSVVLGNIYLATGKDFYQFIDPIILVLYGIPTFISGFVLKFKPLWLGGIGCWILSVAASLVPGDYQVLMLAPAMVIAWIIPGYLLKERNKRAGYGL